MKLCDIDHLHKRFLDIWEWCMRQGFDTRAFTYVENAFKSEPIAEQTEPQTDGYIKGEDFLKIFDEPQTDCSWK